MTWTRNKNHNERVTKKLFDKMPDRREKVGRNRMRWLENVKKKDIGAMHIKR